jgi:hypothetical protein
MVTKLSESPANKIQWGTFSFMPLSVDKDPIFRLKHWLINNVGSFDVVESRSDDIQHLKGDGWLVILEINYELLHYQVQVVLDDVNDAVLLSLSRDTLL